jgi:UDP-N-acetylglucosamine 2-epimerase (non-hydrolysing)
MSKVFLDELGIPTPDHLLKVGSGPHAEQSSRVITGFEPLVDSIKPDIVVVPGDVNSTFACAVVAAKAGSLVAQVQAGLRSRDWSMPEEINRVVIDRVSDYLLAPSEDAVDNLQAEGYGDDQIHLVGNVMVDTLSSNIGRARKRPAGPRLQGSGHRASKAPRCGARPPTCGRLLAIIVAEFERHHEVARGPASCTKRFR